mmetsp:Transcript_26580/g.78954  ORF Transcript_26580/g.78954 Transcript_26580/m.78954 type:complete len:214 (+) Transcript_26580:1924-2565(+)|eukprot:349954-Chlamydomonas_euryale.AAC.8
MNGGDGSRLRDEAGPPAIEGAEEGWAEGDDGGMGGAGGAGRVGGDGESGVGCLAMVHGGSRGKSGGRGLGGGRGCGGGSGGGLVGTCCGGHAEEEPVGKAEMAVGEAGPERGRQRQADALSPGAVSKACWPITACKILCLEGRGFGKKRRRLTGTGQGKAIRATREVPPQEGVGNFDLEHCRIISEVGRSFGVEFHHCHLLGCPWDVGRPRNA